MIGHAVNPTHCRCAHRERDDSDDPHRIFGGFIEQQEHRFQRRDETHDQDDHEISSMQAKNLFTPLSNLVPGVRTGSLLTGELGST
jgi:hypothetical protein